MRAFLIVSSILAVASAGGNHGNFGAFGGSTGNSNVGGGYSGGGASGFGGGFGQASGFNSGFASGSNSGFASGSNSGASGGFGQGISNEGAAGGQVFRYVSVHVAPDEPTDQNAKVLRVPGGGDKHVNIIFVKAPSSSSASQTEVILPEPDTQKNLVYVLLKKAEASDNIKIRRPQAATPTKPEVYFIRYKNQDLAGGAGAGAGAGSSANGGAGAVATFGGNTGAFGGNTGAFGGNTGTFGGASGSPGISSPSPVYGAP